MFFFLLFKCLERINSALVTNDVHPTRGNSAAHNLDLSRALRFDAYLLAIVRVVDKRSRSLDLRLKFRMCVIGLDAFYSAEVVSKLREKERTQSFINKPCSLFVTDRTLIIFDRGTQVNHFFIFKNHLEISF